MKNNLSAMLLCDFYKISHREQYPQKTQIVYSTWTPRTSRIDGIDSVVAFGFQGFIKKYLTDFFDSMFFNRPKSVVTQEYWRIIKYTLGVDNPSTQHISDLHDIGYLPLEIKAVNEGLKVPLRVPMLTIRNTDERFYWLTNYVESLMSSELWLPATSATIAHKYKSILSQYAAMTVGNKDFVKFQGHDFSMRGMAALDAAMSSGAGHLLSFVGTDTIPAIQYLESYYGANVEKELVGTSIAATKHSVMCAYGKDEFACYKRMITEVYPKGFVSIVSDTWDLWKVLSDVIAPLKDTIMAREGKVVIRPDSGDPANIVCGDPNGETEAQRKGVVEILWDIFGGTVSEKGFKVLDPHIGCIYGDAITLSRCEDICKRLAAKGFASTNMVYGIGSFTYQYNTRDTFGFALKSTMCKIDGVEHAIYKDPVTDIGHIKKSQRGCVAVVSGPNNDMRLIDGLTLDHNIEGNLLNLIYKDGKIVKETTLEEVRATLARYVL